MSERWKPEINEKYWYVNIFNEVKYDTCGGFSVDRKLFDSGNCFKTEEEAKAVAEKFKALLLSMHEPTTNSSRLPKLTVDVFNREDCPEWAKYAAVDGDGMACYFSAKPTLAQAEPWWSRTPKSNPVSLWYKFDASDWQNSLIERPTRLPDWCKVDAMGWHKRCGYFKVTYIDEFSKQVDIQQVEDKSKGYLSFHTVCNEVVQARPRPYNKYEMEALVGKAIKTPDGNAYLCTAYQKPNDAYEAAVDVDTWISASGLLEEGYKLNNKPCGKLEHLNEKGEWVE